ncbi:hypothetical protein J7E96_21515 [Streptomyces sp. ISL-96]|uniref:hypothetical protein n=1 Tax=Streptomyces sp. ISL-96 TaxID=2819191 RepID=UPI001BE7FFD2|nr:hypothetical protein [Streptomyces sp. ISL-96]MBT2491050.1 hypothetical protein [Streptomyces sp. ISL-96]
MPATLTPSRTALLSPAVVASLPDVSLIVALYASDCVSLRHLDPAKIAAFMVDGANRWGLAQLIERTCDLVVFWQRCADQITTSEDWAEHHSRFDNSRIIRFSLDASEMAPVRQHLAAMASEAVAA